MAINCNLIWQNEDTKYASLKNRSRAKRATSTFLQRPGFNKGKVYESLIHTLYPIYAIQEFLIGGSQGFSENVKYVEEDFLEVDCNSYY